MDKDGDGEKDKDSDQYKGGPSEPKAKQRKIVAVNEIDIYANPQPSTSATPAVITLDSDTSTSEEIEIEDELTVERIEENYGKSKIDIFNPNIFDQSEIQQNNKKFFDNNFFPQLENYVRHYIKFWSSEENVKKTHWDCHTYLNSLKRFLQRITVQPGPVIEEPLNPEWRTGPPSPNSRSNENIEQEALIALNGIDEPHLHHTGERRAKTPDFIRLEDFRKSKFVPVHHTYQWGVDKNVFTLAHQESDTEEDPVEDETLPKKPPKLVSLDWDPHFVESKNYKGELKKSSAYYHYYEWTILEGNEKLEKERRAEENRQRSNRTGRIVPPRNSAQEQRQIETAIAESLSHLTPVLPEQLTPPSSPQPGPSRARPATRSTSRTIIPGNNNRPDRYGTEPRREERNRELQILQQNTDVELERIMQNARATGRLNTADLDNLVQASTPEIERAQESLDSAIQSIDEVISDNRRAAINELLADSDIEEIEIE